MSLKYTGLHSNCHQEAAEKKDGLVHGSCLHQMLHNVQFSWTLPFYTILCLSLFAHESLLLELVKYPVHVFEFVKLIWQRKLIEKYLPNMIFYKNLSNQNSCNSHFCEIILHNLWTDFRYTWYPKYSNKKKKKPRRFVVSLWNAIASLPRKYFTYSTDEIIWVNSY